MVCLADKRKHFQGSCHSWGHSWVRIFTEGKEQKNPQKNKKTPVFTAHWVKVSKRKGQKKPHSFHRGSFLNLHSCFSSKCKCPLRLSCFRTEDPVSSMINMYLLQNVRFSPLICKCLLESPYWRLQCRKEILILALSMKQGKLLNAGRFFLFCRHLHCSDIILPCRQVNSEKRTFQCFWKSLFFIAMTFKNSQKRKEE